MDYEYKGIKLGDGIEKILDKLEREYIEFDKLLTAFYWRKGLKSLIASGATEVNQ